MKTRSSSAVRVVLAIVTAVVSVTAAVVISTAAAASTAGDPQQSSAAAAAAHGARPTRTTKPPTTQPTTTQLTTTQPTVATSSATTIQSTSPPICASGTLIDFNAAWYCPGFVIGVKNNTYGSGVRIVLRSVNVISVSGTAVRVMGGPSCLQDPNKPPVYCGATVPNVAVSFAGAPAVPRYGDIIDLYGVTGLSTMTATGHVVTGFCDPDFC